MKASALSTFVGKPSVDWLLGSAALEWAARSDHRHQWLALYEACPWATAFQHPSYFDVWCRHYGSQWTPLLLIARNANGIAAAIMPLAVRDGEVTGVGAHQAEYHGFLSAETDAVTFMAASLDLIDKAVPGTAMRLRYLPPGLPADVVAMLETRNDRTTLNKHSSQILRIDRDAIDASLKKKGNKSKLNRLKRNGQLDLRRLDPDEFATRLRRIAAMYDFRQGAVNGVCPFADDPKKAAFHLDWMKTAPQQLHASALMLDGQIASALLLVQSPKEAHLAISALAPEHAENSPMKFQIYQTALALAGEGRVVLDLTPGGPWKARFSTEQRVAYELIMHRSLADAMRTRVIARAKELAKTALNAVGLSTANARAALQTVRGAAGRLRSAPGKPSAVVTYREALPSAVTPHPALHVSMNDLEMLIRHGVALTGRPRGELLGEALERLEKGERFYTVEMQGAPFALAWSPKAGGTIYDLSLTGSLADAALAALIRHVGGKTDTITIVARAADRASTDALARIGAKRI